MTVQELLERETFFDAAILRHGFVDYMRDYELIVGARDGPPHDDLHRYQFVGCAEAVCRTNLRPSTFAESLPDAFVYAGPDYPEQDDPDGFVWGVRYSTAYPGLTYIEDGNGAQHWSDLLGRSMHEVTIETEAFHLRLVFASLRYEFLGREDNERPIPKDYPVKPTDAAAAA